MRQWTGSSLVQVMACRLFGAKPLPEPMLSYCQLDSWEHISVKYESEFYHFHSRKCNWKCGLPKWYPFCPGGDELNSMKPFISHQDFGHDQKLRCHFVHFVREPAPRVIFLHVTMWHCLPGKWWLHTRGYHPRLWCQPKAIGHLNVAQ